jgi:hypothetical protein
MTPRRILYCHCAFAQVVPAETKAAVLDDLCGSGVSFEAVPDLCEMAARRDPALAEIAAGEDVAIVACYPRAVRWLFTGAGVTLPEHVRVLNMRELSSADIAASLEFARPELT